MTTHRNLMDKRVHSGQRVRWWRNLSVGHITHVYPEFELVRIHWDIKPPPAGGSPWEWMSRKEIAFHLREKHLMLDNARAGINETQ